MRIISPPVKRISPMVFMRRNKTGAYYPQSVEARIYIDGGVYLSGDKRDVAVQLLPGEKQTWQFGGMKITIERAESDVVSMDELKRRKELPEPQYR
jgi:hypothetical protein